MSELALEHELPQDFVEALDEIDDLGNAHLLTYRLALGERLLQLFCGGDIEIYHSKDGTKALRFKEFTKTCAAQLSQRNLSDAVLRNSILAFEMSKSMSAERNAKLKYSHLLALTPLKDLDKCNQLANAAVEQDWTIAQLKSAVADAQGPSRRNNNAKAASAGSALAIDENAEPDRTLAPDVVVNDNKFDKEAPTDNDPRAAQSRVGAQESDGDSPPVEFVFKENAYETADAAGQVGEGQCGMGQVVECTDENNVVGKALAEIAEFTELMRNKLAVWSVAAAQNSNRADYEKWNAAVTNLMALAKSLFSYPKLADDSNAVPQAAATAAITSTEATPAGESVPDLKADVDDFENGSANAVTTAELPGTTPDFPEEIQWDTPKEQAVTVQDSDPPRRLLRQTDEVGPAVVKRGPGRPKKVNNRDDSEDDDW